MVLIKNCQVHNLPAHLLCSIHEFPLLLCQKCMGEHQAQADPHNTISLNSITLNYFTLFTAHIADHMHQWSRLVQNSGLRSVFEVRSKDGGVWRCEDEMVVARCAVRVMQEHAELMLNNNRYVTSNQETEGLYHPQCLKDIYNLAAQHWQANAQLLIIKLEGLLWQFCGKECQMANPVVSLNHVRIAQIENYRGELLSKWRDDIFRESKRQVEEKRRDQSQETIGSQKSKASCMEAKEVSPFEVPQVILPQDTAKQETLLADNKLLREQNTSLKCQNVLLQQDCNILREKCMQMQSQRRHPSSSKKRSQVSLQSELLSQIVQLQAQLHDSHHDLQLLITYLNQLASRGVITPLQLKQRLMPLKTITLH